jgi:hypothetical protein
MGQLLAANGFHVAAVAALQTIAALVVYLVSSVTIVMRRNSEDYEADLNQGVKGARDILELLH